jgi:hypothetical protein
LYPLQSGQGGLQRQFESCEKEKKKYRVIVESRTQVSRCPAGNLVNILTGPSRRRNDYNDGGGGQCGDNDDDKTITL